MCIYLTIRFVDGVGFESVIKYKGGFKIKNPIEKQMLKSLVEFPSESGMSLKNLNPLGWFSKKEEPKAPTDKNEIRIEIIKRVEQFPKFLLREGR